MSRLVIVDTDILIDAGRGVPEATACLEQVADRGTLAVSAITSMELIVGCRSKVELRLAERFLARFQLLRLDERITDRALALLREYRLSHGLLVPDALIAATALESEQPLISKNQRDYLFIDGLCLLPYPHRP